MKVYQAIKNVSAAMSHDGISKARKNTAQNYNFRGIDDVLNALSSALVEAELLILPRVISREVVERTTAKGGAIFYVTVEVEFDLVSAEDGSKHTVKTYGEAMDSADKATNKAMSAAYKYLALLTFCIPTEGSPDTDADYSTHEIAAKAKPSDPRARAARIVIGVADGDGFAAADDLSKMDEITLNAIWAHLDEVTIERLLAVWPAVTA